MKEKLKNYLMSKSIFIKLLKIYRSDKIFYNKIIVFEVIVLAASCLISNFIMFIAVVLFLILYGQTLTFSLSDDLRKDYPDFYKKSIIINTWDASITSIALFSDEILELSSKITKEVLRIRCYLLCALISFVFFIILLIIKGL